MCLASPDRAYLHVARKIRFRKYTHSSCGGAWLTILALVRQEDHCKFQANQICIVRPVSNTHDTHGVGGQLSDFREIRV